MIEQVILNFQSCRKSIKDQSHILFLTEAAAIFGRMDSMKLTPAEKQTLQVLRLIYEYNFTFDWNSFPVTTLSMKTPIFQLLSDLNKAIHAMTGPIPLRYIFVYNN